MFSAGVITEDGGNHVDVEEDQQGGANISKLTSALIYAPTLEESSCIMHAPINTHAGTEGQNGNQYSDPVEDQQDLLGQVTCPAQTPKCVRARTHSHAFFTPGGVALGRYSGECGRERTIHWHRI